MSLFITFEGGEGAGKSIQTKMLSDFLISKGKKVILTREPGGTDLAEEIRKIVLIGDPDKLNPLTESLLYLAARSDHWIKKIKPYLDAGNIVISDRFHDSSIVYQGVCKNVNTALLNQVFAEITQGKLPDRTYLLDLDPKIGIARSLSREGNNEIRFEKMDSNFHEKVRKGFLELAENDKKRFCIIDGTLPIDEIHNIIKNDIYNLYLK